jgi:hypothetical protein
MVWQTVEKILDISRKKINGFSIVGCAKFVFAHAENNVFTNE